MSAPTPAPRLKQEFGAVLRLALPLAVAQLAQLGMATTDTILLGSLGGDALAAGGLGANLYFTLMLVAQGLLISVGILVAQARGADDDGRIAKALRGGIVLGTVAAIPPMLLLSASGPILLAFGEPVGLAGDIGRYTGILLLAMPASLWLGAQRAYLAAMDRTPLVMAVSLTALVVNGLLNYGLIHGAFGLPRLGLMGSCTATAITLWGMAAATGLGMRAIAALRRHRLIGPVDWGVVRDLARLGWPIAVTYGVETWLFAAAALTIGLFGTAALAANQVNFNLAATTFMVPLAFSQAANVRVGFHTGGGFPERARKAGIVAFGLGVGFMSLAATAMLALPGRIIGLYLDGANPADVPAVRIALQLIPIVAFFQVFDGAQTIAAGALRGLKDTRVPMLIATAGYWAIGFPTGWALAFPLGLGPPGIWWGLAAGLAVVAVLLTERFWRLSGGDVRGGKSD